MRHLLAILAFVLFGGFAFAQNPVQIQPVTTDPTGQACGSTFMRLLTPQGTVYSCANGVWAPVGGGGPVSPQVLSVTGVGDISVSPANGQGNVVVSDSGSGGGNAPGSGCGIQYTSGLSFTVGACTYSIAGVQYTSPLTNLTLSSADPTNPRIDAIAVDNLAAPNGEAVIITGVPAANPATPSIDPATQLALDYILVPAGATTPGNVTTNTIYDENTEWTSTCTAHLNCASTNNPYHLTKDIEGTAAVLNNNVSLVDPAAGTVDLATQNSLVFYIRSKGQWPTGTSGATAARTLSIFWKNGSTVKGVAVTLRDGAYGFKSSNTTSYQQVSIPASAFGIFGIPVTTLEIQVAGAAGSSSIGFYIDWITLQAGINPNPPPTTGMNFKGIWNSSASYNVNDTVNTANGNSYVALVANTNVAVTTTSTWAPLSPTCGTGLTASGVTCAVDTSVMLSRATDQAGTDGSCIDASGSGTTYTCSVTPALTVYTQNMLVRFVPQTNSSGASTVNINGLGPIPIKFDISGTLTDTSGTSPTQLTANLPLMMVGIGSPVTSFMITPTNLVSALTPSYLASVSGQTSVSISAATHGEGVDAIAFCFDNAGTPNYTNCAYTRDGSGNLVFTFNPAFTGTLQVVGGVGPGSGGGGSGTVNSGTSGQLAYYATSGTAVSGETSVSAAQFPALIGDTTTPGGSLTTTTVKVNGVSYGTSPSTNTVPVVTGTNATTYEAVPNAALANAATTANGQTCTLGGTCNVNVGATAHTVAVNEGNGSAIVGAGPGTAGQVLVSNGSSSDPTFQALVHSIGATFDGSGSALSTSTVVYYFVPYACTITAWNATVDTGTITIDVWKIASGTAIPTVSNTITASATPAIATGTALHSTTLTAWTTSVTANDIFGFNIKAVSGATKASLVLQCQ